MDIQTEYDYGIFLLNCTDYKRQVIEALQDLVGQLEGHLLSLFLNLLYEQSKKNKLTWETVNAKHRDIDGTIQQIDYI